MGLPTSNADIFKDVNELLAAVDANVEALPEAASAKAELQQILAEIHEFSVRRNTLEAEKQMASAQLLARRRLAKQKSSELRNFLRFKLGQRNPKLTEFQVKPLKATLASPKRSRKKAKAPVTPPVEPAPSTTG